MTKISSVTKGPPGLVKKLNEIISFLNKLIIIKGEGINVVVTDSGWIVSVVPPAKTGIDPSPGGSSPATGGGGGGGAAPAATDPNGVTAGWVQVSLIDNSTGTCRTRIGYFWGTLAP